MIGLLDFFLFYLNIVELEESFHLIIYSEVYIFPSFLSTMLNKCIDSDVLRWQIYEKTHASLSKSNLYRVRLNL